MIQDCFKPYWREEEKVNKSFKELKEEWKKNIGERLEIEHQMLKHAKYKIGDTLLDPFSSHKESQILIIADIKINEFGSISYYHKEPNNFYISQDRIFFSSVNNGFRDLYRCIKVLPLEGKKLDKLIEYNKAYEEGEDRWDEKYYKEEVSIAWNTLVEKRKKLLYLCIHDWRYAYSSEKENECRRCGLKIKAV